MANNQASTSDITGEARIRFEGGVAHFPGRARDQIILLDELDAPERHQIATLAEQADFFGCTPQNPPARPDARTYTISLAIGNEQRELRVAEPIADPALASLVSLVRRLSKNRPVASQH